MRAFAAGRERWPTRAEFIAANRQDLWRAVARSGGSAYWARKLGFELAGAQDRRRRSEAELRREAEALITAHGRLPGAGRLRALGHGKLATAVERAGGAAAFCRRHRLR